MSHKKLFIISLTIAIIIMSTLVASIMTRENQVEESITLEQICIKNPDDPLCINYQGNTHEAKSGQITKMNIGPDMFN